MAKNKFDVSMFERIKETLKKSDSTGGSFSDIMKFPAGHTYTIRLIPNVDDIDKTFYHHYMNSWINPSTGQFVSVLSLQTFNERDPINEERWKLYKEFRKHTPSKDVKFDNPIDNKEFWNVNALWVDNPENPELNGTVKVLKLGPQLKKIVDIHMTGARADEYGMSIFDLAKGGADFKIVAETQDKYTTFENSFFTTKSKLNLSDDEIEAIYEQVLDLTSIQPVKTRDELLEIFENQFHSGSVKVEDKKSLADHKRPDRAPKHVEVSSVRDEDEDDIPMSWDEPKKSEAVKDKVKASKKSTTVEDEVKDLLADLEIG